MWPLAGRDVADAFHGDVGGEDEERDGDEPQGLTFFTFISDPPVAQAGGQAQGDQDRGEGLDGRVESESDDRYESSDQSGCYSDDAFGDIVGDGESR